MKRNGFKVHLGSKKFIVEFWQSGLDTICIIASPEGKTRAGVARTCPKDFDKYSVLVGYKVGLQNALESPNFPRLIRKLFWEAFFKKYPKTLFKNEDSKLNWEENNGQPGF